MSFSTTQLTGFGGRRRASNPSVSFITSSSLQPSNATHTYNTISLGAEASNRKIIVCVGWSTGSDTTISTLTVNGVSASQSVATDASGGACGSAIWIADVPTGTSVDVVVTFNASTTRSAIGIFRVVDLNSSTVSNSNTAVAANGSGVISTTINIPANGFAIGQASTIDGSSGQAWTWDSGGTESYDQNLGNQSAHSGSLRTVVAAETGTTFQATTNAGGSRASLCVASWGN